MATLKSEILLCNNIKLDKNYINVLDYSQAQMLELCRQNAVAVANDYSFIRENGAILVGFDYATCLSANYMAYQNKDYSNKWFFAFIDKVEYVSERSTRIFFKIDSWSTFFDNWNTNSVFVHKEHVNDDTYGLHTLPESLETGEYVNVETSTSTGVANDISICVATSKYIDTNLQVNTPNGGLVNGIYQGLVFAVFSDYPPDSTSLIKEKETAVNLYKYLFEHTTGASGDDIIDIFMVPTDILGGEYTEETYQTDAGTRPFKVKFLNNTTSEILMARYMLQDSKKLAGDYVPHNNKLLCFPYRYLLASNGTGQEVVYNWEDFIHGENNYIYFKVHGDLTPNCSMKCIPQDYKGLTSNYAEAINYSKFPTCSWIYDAYTNWLTQNGVNTSLRTLGGLVKIGTGIAGLVAGAGAMGEASTMSELSSAGSQMQEGGSGIGSGASSILGVAMEQYQHSFEPNQARGNISCGDINFTMTKNEIQFYKMSIKPEYARIIDGIFNRFGYVVNTFKHPNITGRSYWNYVQVTAGEKTANGNIPHIYLNEINNAFINGVTIWHNHANLGNFGLVNSIA